MKVEEQAGARAAGVDAGEATLRVITRPGEWASIEGEWRTLFDQSPTAAPPLRWEWLQGWWRLFGPVYGGGGLRIHTVWRGDRLIGALPLYLSSAGVWPAQVRQLRALSTGEDESEETCATYLDLLHLPGEAAACLELIAARLSSEEGQDWDELAMPRLAAGSPLVQWAGELSAETARPAALPRGRNYVADLEGYFARTSRNHRKKSRQLLRDAAAAGVQLEIAADEETADAFFSEMVRLHQERWTAAGGPGAFASRRFTELMRTVHRVWAPRGEAVLARLSVDGEALAILSGFIVGDKCDLYVSGVRLGAGPVRSPGALADLMLMQHLAERGVTRYDLLGGDYAYKQSAATDEIAVVDLNVVRPTLRSGVNGAVQAARGALRRLARIPRHDLLGGIGRGLPSVLSPHATEWLSGGALAGEGLCCERLLETALPFLTSGALQQLAAPLC